MKGLENKSYEEMLRELEFFSLEGMRGDFSVLYSYLKGCSVKAVSLLPYTISDRTQRKSPRLH